MSTAAVPEGSTNRRGQETVFLNFSHLSPGVVSALFTQGLLDNLRTGVIFLDTHGRITAWNFCLEQMTGIGNSVIGKKFTPSLLQMRDLHGAKIEDAQCPFSKWLGAREPITDRFHIVGRSGRESQVELNFHPVITADSQLIGAVVLIVDTSVQIELQRQLDDLYAIAVLDPLTQVANRAEFERILDEYVRTHQAVGLKCSIIIADLDFFKQINDNFGHHVGDLALVSFAQLIKQFVRSHDFIARYGGEEFVILCANCDESATLQRAEEIRESLAQTKQTVLNGKSLTASFGVSELMPGDDATSLFVRADHALLKAKELGRNRVVTASAMASNQLGVQLETPLPSATGVPWRQLQRPPMISEEYAAKTPLILLLQKIRGFMEETKAEILRIEEKSMTFRISQADPKRPSRPISFILDVDLETADKVPKSRERFKNTEVFLRIAIDQVRSRWSKEVHTELALRLHKSFLSYTMLLDPTNHIQPVEPATKAQSRY